MKKHVILIFLIYFITFFSFTNESAIKIGAIYGLTGPSSKFNIKSIEGIQVGLDEINRSGGLLGHKVELLIYDNESTDAGSMFAAQKAVKDSVISILGCAYSSHSMETGKIAQKNKIPMITNIATSPGITQLGDYIFRVCFTDKDQGRVLANFTKNDLKVNNVVIFKMQGSTSKYSQDLADFFKTEFIKQNGIIVGEFTYNENDYDYSEQLTSIKKLEPGAIFIPGYSDETRLICKQAKFLGIDSYFLGGDGWEADQLIDYSDFYSDKSYYSNHWTIENNSPRNRTFISACKNKFGSKYLPTAETALAYDAFYLLYDAIERCKSFDREKIKDSLANTKNFQGITGEISINAIGDPENKKVIINQIGKDKVNIVKTIESVK